MTTRQENRNNMYRSVLNCARTFEKVTATIPNFTVNVNILAGCVSEIHSLGELQRLDRTGITIAKNKTKKELIITASDNSGMILSFAKSTGNDQLLREAKFTESELENVSDVAVLDLVRIVYTKGEENLEALKEYGITAETQARFNDLIIRFNSLIQTPRMGISQKSMATNAINAVFKKADAALENLDFAVNGVRRSLPEFYNAYRSARIVVDLGSGRLALTARVRETGGIPLTGVEFRIKPENSSDGTLVKKTARTGGLNIKTLPAGNYQVTLTKPGYKEKTMTVSVSEKERTEVIVELEKA